MKDFSAKYQGNDFREWYKANYGSDYDPAKGFARTEGMSDVDWAIGSNLYNSFLTGSNLENSYNNSVNELKKNYGQSIQSLNTSKRNSQQTASITLDKLKKYLPTQIKAQGLGGLGVSESSMLQAYNDYNNTMGEIEGAYNANKSILDVNKNTTLSELERAYQADKTDIGINAGQQSENIFQQYLNAYNNGQQDIYNKAFEAIMNSGYSTEAELSSFLNQYKGELNDKVFAALEQAAKGIVSNNAEKKAEEDRRQAYQAIVSNIDYMLADPSNFNDNNILTEDGKSRMLQYIENNKTALGEQAYNAYKSQIESMKVYTEADKKADEAKVQEEEDRLVLTGQKSIEYGGRYYQIQSKLDKGANQIKRNNDFKDKLKELGYSDPFDKNIPNGTTITSNVDNRGSNDFNFWDDVGAFLFSPLGAGAWDSWGNWNEISMTYYNGDWYLSSEV